MIGTQSGWGFDHRTFLWEIHDYRGVRWGWITAEVFAEPSWALARGIIDRFGSCPAEPFESLDWESRPSWVVDDGMFPQRVTFERCDEGLTVNSDHRIPILNDPV